MVKIKKNTKYHSYGGEITPAVPNEIEHDVSAEKPNRKWLTDITEFAIPAGKVYLSPIVDCFDGLPTAWEIGLSLEATLVNTVLDEAVHQTVLHAWHNESRIKKSLGYRSPMEYRRSLRPAA
ncbi:MAG: hypothetical protein J6B85_11870 [Lachnospiraceae bacterium]|nr:hypothetical protein [Lachnospiraceae bacterium]